MQVKQQFATFDQYLRKCTRESVGVHNYQGKLPKGDTVNNLWRSIATVTTPNVIFLFALPIFKICKAFGT